MQRYECLGKSRTDYLIIIVDVYNIDNFIMYS